MPSFASERDDRDAFLVECETSASKPPSPGASGDFGKDSRPSSYGSTASAASTAAPTAPASPTLLAAATQAKDPEQWPLLGGVLPPPGGFSRGGGVPPGLSAADILPLASDPFWCRLRATMLGLFWVAMVALLAAVVVIVVNDTTPCASRTPAPAQHQPVNVSLPLGALPVLLASSRY